MLCSVLFCPVRLESFVLSSKIHGGGYRHFSVKDSQNISITGHHNIRMRYKCGGKKEKSGIKSPHFMVNVEDVIRIHSFSNIEIIIIYSFSLPHTFTGWWLVVDDMQKKTLKKNCSTIHYSVQPSFFRELVIT